MAFTRNKLGKHSQLYKDISGVDTLESRKQRQNNPQSVAQIFAITAQLPEGVAGMVWDMCLTGMGFKEYVGRWEESSDRIFIHGEKTTNRDRQVPAVLPLHRPVLQYKRFLQLVTKVSKGHVKPYDFRRTYATWLESANIPRARRRLYMGHEAQDMTDLYEETQVDAFLVGDGKALRRWIQSQKRACRTGQSKRAPVKRRHNAP